MSTYFSEGLTPIVLVDHRPNIILDPYSYLRRVRGAQSSFEYVDVVIWCIEQRTLITKYDSVHILTIYLSRAVDVTAGVRSV